MVSVMPPFSGFPSGFLGPGAMTSAGMAPTPAHVSAGQMGYAQYYPAQFAISQQQRQLRNYFQYNSANVAEGKSRLKMGIESTSNKSSVRVSKVRKRSLDCDNSCEPPHKKTLSMVNPSRGDGGPPRVRTVSNQEMGSLTKPLFVDCSVEYDLPNVPKIPAGDKHRLLMIPPNWGRRRAIAPPPRHFQSMQMCPQCPPMIQPLPPPHRVPIQIQQQFCTVRKDCALCGIYPFHQQIGNCCQYPVPRPSLPTCKLPSDLVTRSQVTSDLVTRSQVTRQQQQDKANALQWQWQWYQQNQQQQKHFQMLQQNNNNNNNNNNNDAKFHSCSSCCNFSTQMNCFPRTKDNMAVIRYRSV